MKNRFKYLGFAILMVLISLSVIAAVSADTARVGGQLVNVPDDYNVIFENSTYLFLSSDVDHSIIMSYPPMDKDAGQYKDQFLNSGLNFTGDSNYTYGPLSINQQNYTHYNKNMDFYYIEYDNELYVIHFFYPSNESRTESFNPVNTILDSFE